MFDYTLITTTPDGKKRQTTYQRMLEALKMQDEIVEGSPLKAGGTPQVIAFCSMIKRATKAMKGGNIKIQIMHEGNLIASV